MLIIILNKKQLNTVDYHPGHKLDKIVKNVILERKCAIIVMVVFLVSVHLFVWIFLYHLLQTNGTAGLWKARWYYKEMFCAFSFIIPDTQCHKTLGGCGAVM